MPAKLQEKTEKLQVSRLPVLLSESLADAETAEDAVEKIVGVDGADHFAELVERAT